MNTDGNCIRLHNTDIRAICSIAGRDCGVIKFSITLALPSIDKISLRVYRVLQGPTGRIRELRMGEPWG